MRNTIEDKDKLADKISSEDKDTIQEAITEAQDWLNANDDAEKEDLEDKMKDLQQICDPIISQIYGSQGGQSTDDGGEFDDEEL